MKNGLALMLSILFLLVSTMVSAELRGNGYKGEFKSSTIVVTSLFECKEYIRHMSAGDESYGGNLASYGLLDVFDKGDSFVVIRTSGAFTEIVGFHVSGDLKGSSFDGWILNEWVWEASPRPEDKKRSSADPRKSI